jgi:hypothetical protein
VARRRELGGEEPPVLTIVLCPACERRNRVPAERLGRLHTLRCAACGELLGPPPP